MARLPMPHAPRWTFLALLLLTLAGGALALDAATKDRLGAEAGAIQHCRVHIEPVQPDGSPGRVSEPVCSSTPPPTPDEDGRIPE